MSAIEATPLALLRKAVVFFERRQIPYRVVGSLGSMIYGETRFTNDIDILVELGPDDAQALGEEFPPPDFYVSIPAVQEAIARRDQFNIIYLPAGLKIDVIQRKDTEFSRLDLEHGRRLMCPDGALAWFGSPENIILMKLLYFREGRSEKHLRDVAGMLLVQGQSIQYDYIARWAEKLGVEGEWKVVLSRLAS